MARTAATALAEHVKTHFPKLLLHIHKSEKLYPLLREELDQLEAYCDKNEVSITLDVELLCLRNADTDRAMYQPTSTQPKLRKFYSVPDAAKHRLVSLSLARMLSSPTPAPSVSEPEAELEIEPLPLHYLWLSIVAHESGRPPDHIGHDGDLWTVTSRKRNERTIYVRHSGSWKFWNPALPLFRSAPQGAHPSQSQNTVHHPFAPDLVLAFGVWKLGWFPPEDVRRDFPPLWEKARKDCNQLALGAREYAELSAQEIVDALWSAEGDSIVHPRSHGRRADRGVERQPHCCYTQSRSEKQWHAPRVRCQDEEQTKGKNRDEGESEDEGEDHSLATPVPGRVPASLFGDAAADEAEDGYEQVYTAFKFPVWDSNGHAIFRLGRAMYKVQIATVHKYTSNFTAQASTAIACIGNIKVYDIKMEFDHDALDLFLRTVAHSDKAVRAQDVYSFTTPQLMTLIRISLNDQLAAPRVIEVARAYLRAIWSPSLAALLRNPSRLPGADEALFAARHYDVPQVRKRALYELVRAERPLGGIIDASKHARTQFLSDGDLLAVLVARERLQEAWRAIVLSPQSALSALADGRIARHTCPAESRARCEKARGGCVLAWSNGVGQRLLADEYRLDPVCSLDVLAAVDWPSIGFCETCTGSVRRMCEVTKERWWAMLDTWLLPPTAQANVATSAAETAEGPGPSNVVSAGNTGGAVDGSDAPGAAAAGTVPSGSGDQSTGQPHSTEPQVKRTAAVSALLQAHSTALTRVLSAAIVRLTETEPAPAPGRTTRLRKRRTSIASPSHSPTKKRRGD